MAKVRAGQPDAAMIARSLEEIYRGPAWHGPSVLAALEGVDHERARWTPGSGRNSIWDLTLHLAYTRHRLLTRMGEKARRFPRRMVQEWYPALPEVLDAAAWSADLALLEAYQGRLVAAVQAAKLSTLRRIRPGRKDTIGEELLGVAFHDAYHAGQIRLLSVVSRGAH